MEKFKNVLKKRVALMGAFNGLAIIFIVMTGIYGNSAPSGSEHFTDMIHGFQVGVFIGLQIIMVIYIKKYRKALKIADELKKLYVEENDERTKLIQDKIGGVGFNLILGIIATATVIAGFFHQIIFATLFGVLILISLVKGLLKMYYIKKF